jgi:hypothetical protein
MLRRIATWGLALIFLVILVDCVGASFARDDFVEAMLVGWLRTLARGAPRMEINFVATATGVLCIAITLVVLHWLGAWLYREVRERRRQFGWPPAWRWQWTLGLVAAVMLMFIAGLAGVGLFRTTSWFLESPRIFVNRLGPR